MNYLLIAIVLIIGVFAFIKDREVREMQITNQIMIDAVRSGAVSVTFDGVKFNRE